MIMIINGMKSCTFLKVTEGHCGAFMVRLYCREHSFHLHKQVCPYQRRLGSLKTDNLFDPRWCLELQHLYKATEEQLSHLKMPLKAVCTVV